MDEKILERIDNRKKTIGITRSEYLRNLALKDLEVVRNDGFA